MFAYLDPGAGSLLIQVVLAAMVSTGFILRQYVGGSFRWAYRKVMGSPTPVQPGLAVPETAADNPAQATGP